jgi:hypothetical protein
MSTTDPQDEPLAVHARSEDAWLAAKNSVEQRNAAARKLGRAQRDVDDQRYRERLRNREVTEMAKLLAEQDRKPRPR